MSETRTKRAQLKVLSERIRIKPKGIVNCYQQYKWRK